MTKAKVLYPIVKPVLPEITTYTRFIEGVFKRNWLTNNGPLVQELELRLAEYFGVEHLLLVANGTLALQVAYAALNVSGKVFTTPFTFAATASSLCWQNITPKFIDINQHSLNIDLSTINNIDLNYVNDQKVSALVGVHVFGNPCDVEHIEGYAKQHSLKIIYDAAHAFGSLYKGQSLVKYGDAATLSLHATKLFHCVEGGAIIFKEKSALENARKIINFGFIANSMPVAIGINAKMSEMHAAMGLSMLDKIANIIDKRQHLVKRYQQQLQGVVEFQQWHAKGENNGSYMPVIFKSEAELLKVSHVLSIQGIQNRRYFYPSLAEVNIYGKSQYTPVTNDISHRILCLPLYFDLSLRDVDVISTALKKSL